MTAFDPQTSTTVLAFDPGETTGIVSLSVADGIFINVDLHKSLTFPEELYDFLWKVLVFSQRVANPYSAVIIEKFILYAHKAKSKSWSDLPEVRAQGAIEFAAWIDTIPVVLQTASQAKQMVPDRILKDLKIWRGLNTHERDAARHAICYLLKTGAITSLKGCNK